jgi:hypothetical protein
MTARIDEETAARQWRLCPWCGRDGSIWHAGRLPLRVLPLGVPCIAFREGKAPPMVPRERLEHGAYYHGICRNATVARWDAGRQEFVHWRTKLHDVFLETIGYWVDAQPDEQRFDEFRPFGRMENPPFEIPLAARKEA